jgi:hypothetical protein
MPVGNTHMERKCQLAGGWWCGILPENSSNIQDGDIKITVAYKVPSGKRRGTTVSLQALTYSQRM